MVPINFNPQSPAYQVYDQLIKNFGFTDEVIDRHLSFTIIKRRSIYQRLQIYYQQLA